MTEQDAADELARYYRLWLRARHDLELSQTHNRVQQAEFERRQHISAEQKIRLATERERFRVALMRVSETLRVPAAEYVPAIRDAWSILDEALGPTATPAPEPAP